MDISKEIGPFNSPAPGARAAIPKPALSSIRDLNRREGFSGVTAHSFQKSIGRPIVEPRQGAQYQRQKLRAVMAWTKLNDGTRLPTLADARSADSTLLSPLSVIFDLQSSCTSPAISFLGQELEQLAELFPAPSGDEVSASSRLLSLVFEQSADAITTQAPHEFHTKWQDRFGNPYSIAGFALPFSKDEHHVDQVLAAITVGELDQAAPEPRSGAQDPATDELLLDQELEPTADPQLAGPPLAVPFILVSLPGQVEPVSPRKARESARTPNLSLIASDQVDPDDDVLDLASWSLTMRLEDARSLAAAANVSEARSHGALYAAIGSAYDLAIAASQAPEEFEQMLRAANIAVVPRAPMTGIVKLVFGGDYDKTRMAEYSAALAHAKRIGLKSSALTDLLNDSEGGLKRIVQDERRLRRAEQGKTQAARTGPRPALARKLRALPALPLSEFPTAGDEFVLVLAHRPNGGAPVLVGEIPRDVALLERAARKLVADQA